MECKRCLMTDDIPGVKLNEEGICNFCTLHEDMDRRYPISEDKENEMIARIKRRGRGRKYDCLIGISGGVDSSYLLHWCADNGIRALAFHFDNGFNSDFAERNMKRMLLATRIPCIRISIDHTELCKLNKAFLFASVSDVDIPNDIAMGKLYLDVAIKYGIKTCINGHSFRVEGSVPIGWTYMDGRYIQSVYEKYFVEPLRSFPNLTFMDQVRASIRGIKYECPYYHMEHSKTDFGNFLAAKYGYETYQGRHTENEYTAFAGYYIYQRFGIDKRRIEFSAAIRSGLINKQSAKISMGESVKPIGFELYDILNRIGMTKYQYDCLFRQDRRMFYHYWTYHDTFIRYRWLLWLAAKLGFIRMTFYRKYTKRV